MTFPVKPKAYSVEEIRKTFTKAYAPWTKEEDALLKTEVEILFHGEEIPYQGKISRYQFHKEKYLDEVKGIHYSEIGKQ